MTNSASPPKALMHLVLPVGVPLNTIYLAQQHFQQLGDSVAREIASTTTSPITWVLESFAEGSLDLLIRAETDLSADADPFDIVDAVAGGLRHLEDTADRPPFFNDAALQHAKDLARFDGIAVRAADTFVAPTDHLREHVDQVFGAEITEVGTVEGTVESLTVHRRRIFNLYEPYSGTRIECAFAWRIPTETIGHAIEKHAAVQGTIFYRGDTIRRMEAHEIEVYPPTEIPTADDVLGILGD